MEQQFSEEERHDTDLGSLTLGQRLARNVDTDRLAIPEIVGSAESVTDRVMQMMKEVVDAHAGKELNVTIEKGKLPALEGRLRNISRFGFQIVDSKAFDREDANYEIATVLLAKYKEDPSKVVPIVIPHELGSHLGEELRDRVRAEVHTSYGSDPLDLLRPRTGEVFRNWCHSIGATASRIGLVILAAASLGGIGIWGVPRIADAYHNHVEQAYSQTVSGYAKFETLSRNIQAMPQSRQQLEALADLFNYDSPSSTFYIQTEAMLSRPNIDAQLRALKASAPLAAIESTRNGGFFGHSASSEVSTLVSKYGELSLSAPNEQVRKEAFHSLDIVGASRSQDSGIRDSLKSAFRELSLHSTDVEMRTAANQWLQRLP